MEYAAKYETSLEGLVLISSVYTDYKPQNTFAFLKTGLPPKNQIDANKWYMENIDAFLGGYFYNTQAKNIFSNTVTSYSVSAHVGGAKNDIFPYDRALGNSKTADPKMEGIDIKNANFTANSPQ